MVTHWVDLPDPDPFERVFATLAPTRAQLSSESPVADSSTPLTRLLTATGQGPTACVRSATCRDAQSRSRNALAHRLLVGASTSCHRPQPSRTPPPLPSIRVGARGTRV